MRMTSKCPKCGSNDLWQDNFWEGCNSCDYAHNCESNFERRGFTPITDYDRYTSHGCLDYE